MAGGKTPTEAAIRTAFGERLRRAREVAIGIEQEKMAHALGVSPGTQSKYETGVSRPSWRYLWALEATYGIPLLFLWKGSTAGMSDFHKERLKPPSSDP